MKIRPLNDWVVIKPVDSGERTASGIIIPEVAKQKPQIGVVMAVGPGRYKEEKGKGKEKEKEKKKKIFVPTEVKPGDKVMYEKYMVSEFELDGQEVTMIREENILGFLEEEKGKELEKKEDRPVMVIEEKASEDLSSKPSAGKKPAVKKETKKKVRTAPKYKPEKAAKADPTSKTKKTVKAATKPKLKTTAKAKTGSKPKVKKPVAKKTEKTVSKPKAKKPAKTVSKPGTRKTVKARSKAKTKK